MLCTTLQGLSGELLSKCNPMANEKNTHKKKKQTRACGCTAEDYRVHLESCSLKVFQGERKAYQKKKKPDTCLWMHHRRLQSSSRELLSQSFPRQTKRIPKKKKKQTRACGCIAEDDRVQLESCSLKVFQGERKECTHTHTQKKKTDTCLWMHCRGLLS